MIELLLNHPIALAALILGYVLLVVEMCVPGFGVPGILGILLSGLGIYLAQPTLAQALVLIGVFVLLLLLALAICLRSISRGRLSKSKLVLKEVATTASAPEGTLTDDLSRFIHEAGVAQTPLRPAGIAEIAGARLNVVTEGDYIDAGAPVRVVRIEGNRVIVARGN